MNCNCIHEAELKAMKENIGVAEWLDKTTISNGIETVTQSISTIAMKNSDGGITWYVQILHKFCPICGKSTSPGRTFYEQL